MKIVVLFFSLLLAIPNTLHCMRRSNRISVAATTLCLMSHNKSELRMLAEAQKMVGNDIAVRLATSAESANSLFAGTVIPGKGTLLITPAWSSLSVVEKRHALGVARAHQKLHHPFKRRAERSSSTYCVGIALCSFGAAQFSHFKKFAPQLSKAGIILTGLACLKELLDQQLWYQSGIQEWYDKQNLAAERMATVALDDATQMLTITEKQLEHAAIV